MRSLKYEEISSYGQKNVIFSWKLDIGIAYFNLDNLDNFTFSWDLKTEKQVSINVSERTDISIYYVQIYGDISTLWLLITLGNMQKILET